MPQNMIGQNIIITEPSSNLRALGRNALAGKWKLAMLAVVVYELCIQVPSVILNCIFGDKTDLYAGQADINIDLYSTIYNSMPSTSLLASIYMLLVAGAFTLGITLFFLALFRRQQTGVSDIFLGFENFGKALGLMLFQALFILLWSLLFVIPGIIASIRYSQAFFILADDPSKGIRQCMNESKVMMKGNKAKYFCLSLSFIGWILLTALAAGVVEGIVAVLYAPEIIEAVTTVITTLFMVPVTAYMYSTLTGFYEILAGHLIKDTAPAPIEPEAIPAVVESEAAPEVAPVAEAEDTSSDDDLPKEV